MTPSTVVAQRGYGLLNGIIAFLAVILGGGLLGWVAYRFWGGDLSIGSKYSPDGRDSGSMIVLALVGLSLFCYGLWELIILRAAPFSASCRPARERPRPHA
jgi:hypothetical protein